MKVLVVRARPGRFLIDWLIWHGPGWLVRLLAGRGLYLEEKEIEDSDVYFTTGPRDWRAVIE